MRAYQADQVEKWSKFHEIEQSPESLPQTIMVMRRSKNIEPIWVKSASAASFINHTQINTSHLGGITFYNRIAIVDCFSLSLK